MEHTRDDLEAALIDLCEGCSEIDIQRHSGLSDERCMEIVGLVVEVNENYKKRHGLS